MNELKILVLDDEKRLRDEIGEYLRKRKHEVFLASKPSEAFAVIQQEDIDIAVVDIRLPEMSGLEVLKEIKRISQQIEVIMISGHGDMDSVIEAMRNDAFDYFQKPFRMMEMQKSIERTEKFVELNKRLKHKDNTITTLTEKLYESMGSPMIGQTTAIRQVINLMERVAASPHTNVLITGESGTGKELVAHGIHLLSERRKNVFHSVNCSAITDSLFESEFFGHKKGSFTGAFEDRSGAFEHASKGTLFLDEIGDMPLGQQAKLLRTLEDRKVHPVGGRAPIEVDVRVIAASNQHLSKMIEEKRFRSDLYHRLSTFVIQLPPLRERKEDIPLLVDHFIALFAKKMGKKIRQVSPEAINVLMNYSFPGNIRELRNMVERALILADGNTLETMHFPMVEPASSVEKRPASPSTSSPSLLDQELQTIVTVLNKHGYNKSKAAEELGISWQALHRKVQKYGL